MSRRACLVFAVACCVPVPAGRAATAPTSATQAAPATIAGQAPATPWRAATPPPRQTVAGDAVRIEGKLYSPQALFILSRPEERFGRDAVVPHWLQFDAAPASLRSRLGAPPPAASGPSPETVTPEDRAHRRREKES
jgi:hypothetical protein